MNFYLIGCNHKTASVSIREQLALLPANIEIFTKQALALSSISEITVLSTCNRTEIYFCALGEPQNHFKDLIKLWSETLNVNLSLIQEHIYTHESIEAIKHLMLVACGLDSLILGEPQILGQLKHAHQLAQKHKSTGKHLNQLFQKTFYTAKKVRTETAIGKNAVSVAFAAVNLAKQIFTNLSARTTLLIGAGETIELVIKHLQSQGVSQFIIANRTIENAQALISRLEINAQIISLDDLNQNLHFADIIITSTAASEPIIQKEAIKPALKKRRHQPMLMIDLAVPRDIHPQVDELDDIYLYTLDHLEDIISINQQNRESAAQDAMNIIKKEANTVQKWQLSLETNTQIQHLTLQAQLIQKQHIQKALKSIKQGKSPEDVLQKMAHQLSRQLLHPVIMNIKQQNKKETKQQAQNQKNQLK